MQKAVQYGYINDKGEIIVENPLRLKEDLRQLKGHEIELIVKKKGTRTSKQNRYYRGVVLREVCIRMNDLGNEVNDNGVHETLKGMFGGSDFTTTETNPAEFNKYLEDIKRWAAEELDIYIPDPNQKSINYGG